MTYFGKYSFICEPIDYSGSAESLRLIRLGWWLMLLKIVEFADTVSSKGNTIPDINVLVLLFNRFSLFCAKNSRTYQPFM